MNNLRSTPRGGSPYGGWGEGASLPHPDQVRLDALSFHSHPSQRGGGTFLRPPRRRGERRRSWSAGRLCACCVGVPLLALCVALGAGSIASGRAPQELAERWFGGTGIFSPGSSVPPSLTEPVPPLRGSQEAMMGVGSGPLDPGGGGHWSDGAVPLDLTSSVFEEGSHLPARYLSRSPPLSWPTPPDGTKSLILLAEDPEGSPTGSLAHWVVLNVPPTVPGLDEGIPPEEMYVIEDMMGRDVTFYQGVNDFERVGYRGPDVAVGAGEHVYRFHLYAVDGTIEYRGEPLTARDVERMLERNVPRVLGYGQIAATYVRYG